MARFFTFAWKNVLRNRRRSLLTVSSLAFSLCLLGLMLAIYYTFYLSDTPPTQALRLYTRNRVSITLPIPGFYLQRVQQTPGVREAMPWQWFGGVYKDARDPNNFFARFGVDPEKVFTIFSEFEIPEDQKKAFQADRRSCIVGRELAKVHGFKIGDRVTLQGDIYPMDLELTVRGIFAQEGQSADMMLFHWDYVKEGLDVGRRDALGTIAILAKSPEAVPGIIDAVDGQFRNSTAQTRTETERAFGLGFLNQMANVKLILLSICGAVTFTIMLVSANTMAMSVRERVREVGILKTLGFRPGTILGIILGEATMIALFGALGGYVLASSLCSMMRQGMPMGFLSTLSIQPPVIAVMFIAAIVIAMASSFVPAFTASRVDILDALRRTD